MLAGGFFGPRSDYGCLAALAANVPGVFVLQITNKIVVKIGFTGFLIFGFELLLFLCFFSIGIDLAYGCVTRELYLVLS